MRIVMKFGGSSLATPERVRAAARRAADAAGSGAQTVVVVSAQGDTTDHLLAQARQLCPSLPRRELDACLAAGEQVSAALMAMALTELGCRAVSLTGAQAGLCTDGVYGDARITGLAPERILKELDCGNTVVVAGFQGRGPGGDTVTLGRGGSDTTAVALAAFLPAEQCLIYTDVDGIYDRDPRKFADAVHLPQVSYGRMLTMAREGAQVLHDRCVELAREHHVPIRVLSSFRPGRGTLVWDGLCPNPT